MVFYTETILSKDECINFDINHGEKLMVIIEIILFISSLKLLQQKQSQSFLFGNYSLNSNLTEKFNFEVFE